MKKFLLAFGLLPGIAPLHAAPPVPFTLPYNADLVREPGGTTAGLDNGGRGFVSAAEAIANGAQSGGLPDDGTLATKQGTWQLAPYDKPNALRINNNQSITIKAVAGAFNAVLLLCTATDGGATLRAVPRYADGDGAAEELSVPDWNSAGENTALNGLKRTGERGAGFEKDKSFALFAFAVPLETGRALQSLTLQRTGGGTLAIFAAAGGNITLPAKPIPAPERLKAPRPAPRAAVDFISPMIGAVTTGESAGKTFPGPAMPFGMVQLSPDTVTGGDNAPGYSADHKTIEGFSFTRMSGTGWYGDFGNLQIMPQTGPLITGRDAAKSLFDKATEVAEIGYYSVWLQRYGVQAELTAAPRAGLLRFTFPASPQSRIKVDLERRIGGRSIEQFCKQTDERTVEGWMNCDSKGGGWGHGAGNCNYILHFSMQFNVPIAKLGTWDKDEVSTDLKERKGTASGFFVEFPTTEGQQVLVKAGISFVSIEGARANLQHDIPDWNFERVQKAARASWAKAIDNVAIEGASDEQKRVFYTALYHTMIDPRSVSDVDGTYIGADRKPHRAKGFVYRSVFSGWDVFRSQFPLQTIINPRLVNDEINSLMQVTELGGTRGLARWEIMSVDSGCMIGDPAISVFNDAYQKGIRGYDVEKAYALCRGVALGPPEQSNRGQLRDWLRLGYAPGSLSLTLESAYFDYCTARFAEALGHKDDAAKLYKSAQNYRNIYDPQVGNMRAKDAAGNWTPWRGKTAHGQGCVESNPWQQGWFVPQDVQGLIDLMGGREKFIANLTEFFEKTPEHMLWNDFYNHSNEPVHHVPFLFSYAGAPWLTQKWSRTVCERAYQTGPRGLIGNEDVGQMSAWYILAATGFHPVCPGDNVYILGSPLFSKTTLRLDPEFYKGKSFTVLAKNNAKENLYIQSAKLNGKPLPRAWITHDEVVRGGTLELEMGPQPNKEWGAAPEYAPPSLNEKLKMQN